MARPKSNLRPVMFRLSQGDLDRLDRIARHFGLVTESGTQAGEPNRAEAMRKAIREMDNRIVRKSKKNEES